MDSRHTSVLLQEAIEGLCIEPGDTVVDATVGGAGHFLALGEALQGPGTLVGIDADADALGRGARAAGSFPGVVVHLVHDNFRNLDSILTRLGIENISKALFDLGWSGYHLESGRGFSFRADEPLLMTYGEPEEGKTAADAVNSLPEEMLVDILFTLGEERFARHIARGIVGARRMRSIVTSKELVDVIVASTPSWYQHRRTHPATKTFQALRMYVNDELGALREGLTSALSRIGEQGRVAVITFHSIEDRVVKNIFRDAAREGAGSLVTKKPVLPSAEEVRSNPRARSAKLRVFEKTTTHAINTAPHSRYTYA